MLYTLMRNSELVSAMGLTVRLALAMVEGHRYLLARYLMGIRPLYYGFNDGSMCFASEIEALARRCRSGSWKLHHESFLLPDSRHVRLADRIFRNHCNWTAL